MYQSICRLQQFRTARFPLIDDTLTCPSSLEAVQACKRLGCDLAIVTARPVATFHRVDDGIVDMFRAERAPFKYLPDPVAAMDRYNTDLRHAIARTKTAQLHELRGDDDVTVLFFDDVETNVSTARSAGFSATLVEDCHIDANLVLEAHSQQVSAP